MKEIKNRFGEILYRNDASRDDKYLSHITLKLVYLEDINFKGYNFKDSSILYSNLQNSNLEGANFERADICCTDFKNCNLKNCNFTGAFFKGSNFTRSNLQGFIYDTCEVPVIDNIHIRLYEAITREGCSLYMSEWHTCDTTHCRACWIVHFADEKCYELERHLGSTVVAATFIYFRSDPNMTKCPDFYENNLDAMEDIKRMAGIE